jgi:putative hydrolase of the HAD superfamily
VPNISTIGIDADDTLWQSEHFFKLTQTHFAELLADYAEPSDLGRKLLAAEKKNLQIYGFGIKGFVLSMIETAIEITDGEVPTPIIQRILAAGHEMLAHPVLPLPNVRETLENLSQHYRLILITKGDLFDQERKLAGSGLGELFHAIEIVSEKAEHTYQRIFDRHGQGPDRAMMVGNSLRSDIIPAIAVGSWGVFIPHDLTWEHEHAEMPLGHPRFRQIEKFRELVGLIEMI